MKKKYILILCVVLVCVLLVLFLPIPCGSYDDGGTREYAALTYKVVIWKRLYVEIRPDGTGGSVCRYQKTTVYWFSDAHKDIDELWEIESNSPDFFDHIIPQA